MPANKLTQAEKEARGTHKRSRDLQPRPLKQVRREIRETRQALKDIQWNLAEAGKAIREEGVVIEYPVTDSSGAAHVQKKPHPALKIQRESLTAIKDLKRSLVLLREEESLALATKTATDEFSEFA
ncbi:MAG TPA: hypothetical protein VFA85_15780 [Terriglobales bacterium]|nr:hypothetical protein [Terriglobales bacterium]